MPLLKASLAKSLLLAALIAGPASETLAQDNKIDLGNGVSFAPYGHTNLAYSSYDDGQVSTKNIVDISGSTSRFGFRLFGPEGDVNLSFRFETSLGFRPSQSVSQVETLKFWNWSKKSLRQVSLILGTDFGKFTLGQGSMASDGATSVDLAGTVSIAKSVIPESVGSMLFRDGAGNLTDVSIKQTFLNFDGKRYGRIRYDTPTYNGFYFAASYGKEILTEGVDDTYYDAALYYEGKLNDYDLAGAVALLYTDTDDALIRDAVGSASVLHVPTGLNLSAAAGRRNTNNERYLYLKGGLNRVFFKTGKTKLVAEFWTGENYRVTGADSGMWGLAVMQDFDDLRLELYAGYRAFSYDDTTATRYQDAGSLLVGSRWKF